MRRIVILSILLAVATSSHAQGLTVTFTTTPVGGPYAPKNIGAVWIETSTGTFVKTIDRWANQRKQYLLGWIAKAGNADTDAISSATRANHTAPLTASWDLKDKVGTVVADGTYTLRMELADSDAASIAANHEATFTFVKGSADQTQPNLSNNGFQAVTIAYSASASCGNGVLDPSETCDPPGSCPASCTPSADACTLVDLVGTAATCTASCQTTTITMCGAADGCCPVGCDQANDADCAAPGSGSLQGGCAASGSSSGSGAVLCAMMFLWRRRTRRRHMAVVIPRTP